LNSHDQKISFTRIRNSILINNHFFYLYITNVTGYYTDESVRKLKEFLTSCRKKLKSESNLFWVALQSNAMADLQYAGDDLTKAVGEMKEDLARNEWILPKLQSNMQNQLDIANITLENNRPYAHKMQSTMIN